MYGGAVAVPLIIARAVNLPPEQVSFLISADLFACGLAAIVQSRGLPGVGIRLPVMMGVTFASVGPTPSMAATSGIGLLGICGAVIGAGIFSVFAAPFISRLWPCYLCFYRHDHPRDRYFADAGGHKLGRRWFADVHQSRRWHAGRMSESWLRPAHRSRRSVIRAGRYPLADQMGLMLRSKRGGAAWNCRRHSARRGNRI